MANAPSQFPRFDLPDAEYFSLAPNAQIALQGRRRRTFRTTTASNFPASSSGAVTVTGILEQPFPQTSGIFLHFFWLFLDPTASGLTVSNTQSGLTLDTTTPFGLDYPLGNPVLTTPTINISVALLTDRNKLISAKDIFRTVSNTLSLTASVFASNTTAGAITTFLQMSIIYTRIDGLTE